MSFSAFRFGAVFSLCFLLASCSKPPARRFERVAIVPPENLSGDPDAEWIGRAVADIAAARTAGDTSARTVAEGTLREAALHRATRTVSGYLVHAGNRTALTATVRDEVDRKNLRTLRSSGDVFVLAEAVAGGTGARLRPYTTTNAAAVEQLYRGISATDPEAAEDHIGQAISLDPKFGSAHLARVDLLLRSGKRDEARNLIGPALTTRLTDYERARLELLQADFAGDQKARSASLLRIAEMRPGDTELWTALATTQMASRDYQGVVRSLGEVLEVSPADEGALNLRGYAYAFAGDSTSAMRSMEEYRNRLPDSANAIDSLGEVNFFFGRFDEASRLFLEAHTKNPGLLGGIEPLRAAFALYMGGNLNAANTLVGTLRPGESAVAGFRGAVWRRVTGQPPAGMPETPASRALQALWLLSDGKRSEAAALAVRVLAEAREPAARGMATLTALLSQPSALPDAWKERLARALPAPQAANERQRLLGWALLLDKQPGAAAEVWRDFANRTPPPGGNEERLLLAWSLVEAGRTDEARRTLPQGLMPPDSFDPSLTSLAWERARNIYTKLHQRQ